MNVGVQRRAAGLWPSPDQELLLKAVLAGGDQALDAWERWRQQCDIEHLEGESTKLLPQLYLNLRHVGVPPEQLTKLKGTYRHHWYRNRLLLQHLATLATTLRAHAIPVVLFDHAALIALALLEMGARPMRGSGLAVPPENVMRAAVLLEDSEWTPRSRPARRFTDAYLQFDDGHSFQHASGLDLRLQWRLLQPTRQSESEAELWTTATEARLEGVDTPCMHPTDLLLYFCASGAHRHPSPGACWVADSAAILRSAEVDWDRFVQQARRLGRTHDARDRLQYLSDAFALPIPSAVFAELPANHPPQRKRRPLLTRRLDALRDAVYRMASHLRTYLRLQQHHTQYKGGSGFLRYWREIYNVERNYQVIVHLVPRSWSGRRQSVE